MPIGHASFVRVFNCVFRCIKSLIILVTERFTAWSCKTSLLSSTIFTIQWEVHDIPFVQTSHAHPAVGDDAAHYIDSCLQVITALLLVKVPTFCLIRSVPYGKGVVDDVKNITRTCNSLNCSRPLSPHFKKPKHPCS